MTDWSGVNSCRRFTVGFRSLALVVEGVEVLLQTRVGGDARIDGAAKGDLALVPLHRRTSQKTRACRGCDTPVSRDSFSVGVALHFLTRGLRWPKSPWVGLGWN